MMMMMDRWSHSQRAECLRHRAASHDLALAFDDRTRAFLCRLPRWLRPSLWSSRRWLIVGETLKDQAHELVWQERERWWDRDRTNHHDREHGLLDGIGSVFVSLNSPSILCVAVRCNATCQHMQWSDNNRQLDLQVW